MSEYIFKTENPIKCCEKCPLIKDNGICGLGARTYSLGISINCPLKKVPEHGDLVDREDVHSCMANDEAKDITDAQKYAISGILEVNDELEFTGKTKYEAYLFIKEHIDDYESYKKQKYRQNYRQEELEDWEIWEKFSTY